MTLRELSTSLKGRRAGIGYAMWKQAVLIGSACFSKSFPKTPEEASPELYPKKVGIQMPDFLKEKYYKKGGN